jgi:hypothetical protein
MREGRIEEGMSKGIRRRALFERGGSERKE